MLTTAFITSISALVITVGHVAVQIIQAIRSPNVQSSPSTELSPSANENAPYRPS